MRSKYFLIKVSGIVLLIFIIILYFLVYFIPSLKAINRYKRELKDMNLKIADFVQQENTFTFANEQERRFFAQISQELTAKIPEVRTREDFIALFTRVSDYIQKLARKDGIDNLVLKSDSKELSVNASTLSSDKKALDDLLNFATRRLLQLRKERDITLERLRGAGGARGTGAIVGTAGNPDASTDLYSLVKNINFQTITLSFTGELANAANFIDHIPWSEYYLSEDKIVVSSGDVFPYYIVFLKIYYIDMQGET
jgi:hypothetical protein